MNYSNTIVLPGGDEITLKSDARNVTLSMRMAGSNFAMQVYLDNTEIQEILKAFAECGHKRTVV